MGTVLRDTLILMIHGVTEEESRRLDQEARTKDFPGKLKEYEQRRPGSPDFGADEKDFRLWYGRTILQGDSGNLKARCQRMKVVPCHKKRYVVEMSLRGSGDSNDENAGMEKEELYYYNFNEVKNLDYKEEWYRTENVRFPAEIVELFDEKIGSTEIQIKIKAFWYGSQNPKRLVIFAHGEPNSNKIANRSPSDLIKLLTDCGFPQNIKEKLKISLVACYGAQDLEKRKNVEESFAHEFHELLKRKMNIICELTARAAEMKVMKPAGSDSLEKMVRISSEEGAKDNGYGKKQPGTKYRWTWTEDGQQQIFDAYENKYNNPIKRGSTSAPAGRTASAADAAKV